MTVFRDDISGRVLAIRIDWFIPKSYAMYASVCGAWIGASCSKPSLASRPRLIAVLRSEAQVSSVRIRSKDEGFAAQVICNCSARKGEVRVWRASWAWWLGTGIAWATQRPRTMNRWLAERTLSLSTVHY
jgi:hypothetical protein